MANEKTSAKKVSSTARKIKRATPKRQCVSRLKGAGPMISIRPLSPDTVAFINALTESFYRAKLEALSQRGTSVDPA